MTLPTDLLLELPQQRSHVVDWTGPCDKPAILLIHGLASNVKMWQWVAPKLADEYRTVAIDQRSHGLTPAPADDDFGFSAICDDMHLICDRLGIKRALVVGHSWGSHVALEFASRHPDRTTGVVLIDGGFIGLNKVVPWSVAEKMMTPRRWVGTPLAELQEWAQCAWGKLYRAEILDVIMADFEVRADRTIAPRLSFENHVSIQREVFDQDVALYSQIKSTALFLPCAPPKPHDAPTEQVLNFKRHSLAQMQALMPQAQVEWLVDAVHDVPLQYPELLAEKIRTFSRALDIY